MRRAAPRLALTENVTSGCVLPLWGLPFTRGDRMLIGDCEHPGVVAACVELARREQLSIDVLPVKHLRGDQASTDRGVLNALQTALTPRTRLVVLSHLLWNTGQVMPIPAVADARAQHPQHPFLLVDAAQSFGQIPVTAAAASADIYGFTGHKWACGPEGLGGVALSERVLEDAQPTLIGWRSLRDETKADLSSDDPFHHDSRRFEVATSCVPLLAGLRTSMELLEATGDATARLDAIQTLSGSLWRQLQAIDGVEPLLTVPPGSGLVSFQLTNGPSPSDVVKQLGSQGLWIRDLADPSCLRACTHLCCTSEELEAPDRGYRHDIHAIKTRYQRDIVSRGVRQSKPAPQCLLGLLAVVEVHLLRAKDLIVLVALPGHQHQIICAGVSNRRGDRGRTIPFDHQFGTRGDPSHHVVKDPLGIFRARVIRGHHDTIGMAGGNRSHLGPLAPVPVTTTPEDTDQAPVAEGPCCSQSIVQPVRRVGVIDQNRRKSAGLSALDDHTLHPAGHTAKRRNGLQQQGQGEVLLEQHANRLKQIHH